MAEQPVKFRNIRYTDPAAARRYQDGCTSLPEEQAEEEVMSGLAEYVVEAKEPLEALRLTTSAMHKTAPQPAPVGFLQRKIYADRGRMLRVAWVQDYSRRGGAELSAEVVVRAGELCGFDVVGVTPKSFNEQILATAELLIVNNLHEFSVEQFELVRKYLFEWRKPYVKYEHDYRELKRENVSRPLFECSRLNVFLSPAHAQGHAHLMSEEARARTVSLPLAVDVDWYPATTMTEERRNVSLLPTPRKYGNGMLEYVRGHPKRKYLLLGQCTTPLGVPNVENLKPLPPERMAEAYAQAGEVVHLPEQQWAGERVVLEAMLCGCVPVVNSNVGHTSWPWFTNGGLRERLAAAPYQFWKAVDGALCR